MIRIIGDVHTKFKYYVDIIAAANRSVQVGDFGIGFNPHNDRKITEILSGTDHRFIRGNHDKYKDCLKIPNFIDDGTVVNDMMFIGGAFSVDRAHGIEGRDWWTDEEIEYSRWNTILDTYDLVRPSVLFTHDCPQFVADEVFSHRVDKSEKTITRNALESAYSIHVPKFHFFGHWHTDIDVTIGSTRFICLGELSYVDFDEINNAVIKRRFNG